jgi:16S rRNA (adenine1518-N6/adenine1519-N6)-dimethyltransferase
MSYLKPQKIDEKLQPFLNLIIRSAFGHRRKTLVNSLCAGDNTKIEKEKLLRAMDSLNMERSIRAEEIPLEMFLKLAENIYEE